MTSEFTPTRIGANFKLWHMIETLLRSVGPENPLTAGSIANKPEVREVARRPGDAQEIASILNQLWKKGMVTRPFSGQYHWKLQPDAVTAAPAEAPAIPEFLKKENGVTQADKVKTAEAFHTTPVGQILDGVKSGKVRTLTIRDNGLDIHITLSSGATVRIHEA